jgi:phenylalanyl-tRNA synthetase alpha chain
MDWKTLVKSLHPLEVRVLLSFGPGSALTADLLCAKLDYKVGQANQAFSWLVGKGLASETGRSSQTVYEITDLGREQLDKGTPEEHLVRALETGSIPMAEAAALLGIEQKDMGSAYGQLAKEGLLGMDETKRIVLKTPEPSPRMKTLRALLIRAANGDLAEDDLKDDEKAVLAGAARKRGSATSPFKVSERETVTYTLGPDAGEAVRALKETGVTGEELNSLTSAHLAGGGWKGRTFRAYNVQAPAARLIIGRRNPYQEFILGVKDKLVGLGFEEFDGPLVETEFWNGDALFMPQFHAARDIHDVYYAKNPTHAKAIEQPWLDRVAAAHTDGGDTGSRGWQYNFDRDFTRRLVLRSQGTVLSAKQLPQAKVPGKYFGVVRCFRYDQVDATHGADFYQTEGIVLGRDVNLRTLLGLLKMFAVEVAGATEVKYVPGYFPFTEPSIEVHIKHPVLGWFELGGSGIFRPEVTKSLGIDVPVLAWGLGIDRMALMSLGLSDLRELFTNNLETLRLRKRK